MSLQPRTGSRRTQQLDSDFFRNVGWRGGPAPARTYIPELLDDVLAGAIDYETDLEHVSDAYQAMDERRAIKSLLRVGSL